jgi:iron-sulfur cluster repair protein YtfE (RIC family)
MKNLETRADITQYIEQRKRRTVTAQKLIASVISQFHRQVTERELLEEVEEVLRVVADNAYADGVYDGRNTECERAKNLTS